MTATKERRKERLRIIYDIDKIQATHCAPCPISEKSDSKHDNFQHCTGCENFKNINKLGEELNSISNKNKKIPEVLNKTAFLLLQERGWSIKEIRDHYKINGQALYFFLEANGLKKTNPKYKNISLEEYLEWKNSGESDWAFCQDKDITAKTLANFKNHFGIEHKEGDPLPSATFKRRGPGSKIKMKPEDYYEYKRQEKTDEVISDLIGVNIHTLRGWKKTNGIKFRNKSYTKREKSEGKSLGKSLPKEPKVAKESKEMPTIDDNFEFGENVKKYFESRSEKSDEFKNKNVAIEVQSSDAETKILENQYEIERLTRELELEKELKVKAERQLGLYISECRSLADEREEFKNRIDKLLPEMEDLQTMNLIFMKKMISLDTVLKERGI